MLVIPYIGFKQSNEGNLCALYLLIPVSGSHQTTNSVISPFFLKLHSTCPLKVWNVNRKMNGFFVNTRWSTSVARWTESAVRIAHWHLSCNRWFSLTNYYIHTLLYTYQTLTSLWFFLSFYADGLTSYYIHVV